MLEKLALAVHGHLGDLGEFDRAIQLGAARAAIATAVAA